MFRRLVLENDFILVERLLRLGQNPFVKFDHDWSALHICCIYGYYRLAEIFLDFQLNPNGLDDFHYSPLFYSVVNGDRNLVTLLLNRGANPRLQIGNNETVLQYSGSDLLPLLL